MNESCGNCRFFAEGACRRFPPIVIGDVYTYSRDWGEEKGTETSALTTYPTVGVSEWCGEWRGHASQEMNS